MKTLPPPTIIPVPEPVSTHRMGPRDHRTNPVFGRVRWNPAKSIWYTTHVLVAIAAAPWIDGAAPVLVSMILTVVTLCCGHTVGLHRLLIHRSFQTPEWFKRTLVWVGTLVGMGGPLSMIYLHEIRDWAQRHRECHPFFIHREWIGRDWWWNLHCRIDLEDPPEFTIEREVGETRFYRWLERTWMWQQLPLALILWFGGGIVWVAWGISGRIALSLTGHWLVGWFAHNLGKRTWHLRGHAVQGYNLPGLGLLTMGESWHNNHHAYPDSARLGHGWKQLDPGWWFVRLLMDLGLANQVAVPENLPERRERERIA
jgi:stearoyl-CoA desaturase (delta-9 desaturase)